MWVVVTQYHCLYFWRKSKVWADNLRCTYKVHHWSSLIQHVPMSITPLCKYFVLFFIFRLWSELRYKVIALTHPGLPPERTVWNNGSRGWIVLLLCTVVLKYLANLFMQKQLLITIYTKNAISCFLFGMLWRKKSITPIKSNILSLDFWEMNFYFHTLRRIMMGQNVDFEFPPDIWRYPWVQKIFLEWRLCVIF